MNQQEPAGRQRSQNSDISPTQRGKGNGDMLSPEFLERTQHEL